MERDTAAIYVGILVAGFVILGLGISLYVLTVSPFLDSRTALITEWLNANTTRFDGDDLMTYGNRVDLMREYQTITPSEVARYTDFLKSLDAKTTALMDAGPGPVIIAGIFIVGGTAVVGFSRLFE